VRKYTRIENTKITAAGTAIERGFIRIIFGLTAMANDENKTGKITG